MSLAVFTDWTTAQASPALSWRSFAGNSTKTTSVNSCCAWSVMPTVAVSPLTRTHSLDFAYLKSEGMLDMGKLRQGWWIWSIRFSIDGLGHDDRSVTFAANLNFNRRLRLGKFRLHVSHADADVQRRALRAADDFADGRGICAGAPDGIMRARRRGFISHLKRNRFFADTLCLLLRQNRAPNEISLVE